MNLTARRAAALIMLTMLVILAVSGSITVKAAPLGLQQQIDRAQPGETLVLPAGLYEGPATINKPIRILADAEARLVNKSGKPAIHIAADGVRLEGLHIVDESSPETAAVLVTANDSSLERLHITTRSFGIKLEGAARNRIDNVTIVWGGVKTAKMTAKRNGIDLYKSDNNAITANVIADMHDGIYMESSHENVIADNRIDGSRYGIHCMYADRTVIRHNTGAYNVTGAMIMGVKDVEVFGNEFYKQSENVNSQGILLFDVKSSRLFENKVEGNRVGFYVEQSRNNELLRNEVSQNFIGIQFIEAESNVLHGNRFMGNVVEAEARSSANNRADGNYWDSFRGIDADGDGRSEIGYAINPFFQTIAKSRPAYQLFFQSPGMVFLEGMFQSGRDSWTTDSSPLMKPPAFDQGQAEERSMWGVGLAGAALLAASLWLLLYMGVKRS